MSRNERKGKEKQIKGKIREDVGIIKGNRKEQLKGKVEQAEGKAREDIGARAERTVARSFCVLCLSSQMR